MITFVNVSIANRFDDSTRNKILVFDQSDTNVKTYLTDIVKLYIDLNEYSDEYIDSINEIKPINISSEPDLYDKINNIIN